MSAYWSAAKLLFQRIAVFGKPAVVHIEPDFWAYAAQQSNQNPASMKVLIASQAPDCAGLPENLVGMGKCWIKLARTLRAARRWSAFTPRSGLAARPTS